jgi:hypothetical protein
MKEFENLKAFTAKEGYRGLEMGTMAPYDIKKVHLITCSLIILVNLLVGFYSSQISPYFPITAAGATILALLASMSYQGNWRGLWTRSTQTLQRFFEYNVQGKMILYWYAFSKFEAYETHDCSGHLMGPYTEFTERGIGEAAQQIQHEHCPNACYIVFFAVPHGGIIPKKGYFGSWFRNPHLDEGIAPTITIPYDVRIRRSRKKFVNGISITDSEGETLTLNREHAATVLTRAWGNRKFKWSNHLKGW